MPAIMFAMPKAPSFVSASGRHMNPASGGRIKGSASTSFSCMPMIWANATATAMPMSGAGIRFEILVEIAPGKTVSYYFLLFIAAELHEAPRISV